MKTLGSFFSSNSVRQVPIPSASRRVAPLRPRTLTLTEKDEGDWVRSDTKMEADDVGREGRKGRGGWGTAATGEVGGGGGEGMGREVAAGRGWEGEEATSGWVGFARTRSGCGGFFSPFFRWMDGWTWDC